VKNISKFISIFFLSFSTLFFFYVFYRDQIYHNGTEFNYYLKYYIIALILIVISFISYFIPKNLKINSIIFFLSIFVGLYIIEGYLNIKFNKFTTYKTQTGKDYDQRALFEIYQNLKKKNQKIVVSPSPIDFNDTFDIAPLSGIANRKTIHCNENGYYSVYQSDRYGFNNPDLEWDKTNIDFLLVGDSMVRGACVNEPNTFSGNLKKLQKNRKGVLNLGQTGNGPLRQYATLREYLPFKDVKRVIWFYSEGNDLKEMNKELEHKILLKYLKDKNFSQNLILRKKEIKKLLLSKLNNVEEEMKKNFKLQKKLNRSTLVSFLILKKFRIYFLESFFHNQHNNDYIFMKKELKSILKLSNKLTKDNNSKLYFVYLPIFTRFQLNNNDDSFQNYKEVIEIVKSLNIPIIDINKELFDKHKDPLALFPFRAHGHYNIKGYEMITKKIFDKINELEKIN